MLTALFISLAMIGPPTIKVLHSNKFIILKLQAPRSAYKRKRGSMIPMTNYYDLLYQVFIINNLLDEVSAYSDINSLPLKSQESTGTLFPFTAETAPWDWKSANGCVRI